MAKLALDEVENIVGKGGNAGHQYFYFVHNVFEKLDFLGAFNPFPKKPWFLRVCSMSFENPVGKEEIADNEQFLLFPQ